MSEPINLHSPRNISPFENSYVSTYTPSEKSKDWLKEYLSTIKPTDKLWFHVLLSPQSNVVEIFEGNFMPMNGFQYNTRIHHRRNNNNSINYYTPDVTRFKRWMNQRLPPDEGEIVDILTLQDYYNVY